VEQLGFKSGDWRERPMEWQMARTKMVTVMRWCYKD